ncbi:MAG: hypothetical protein KAV87_17420 [Desulfobacteraceae bacterium]|nr:hypothetical protein [Desulfobacteraceae bacterium]
MDTKPRYFRVLKTGEIGLYCGKLPVRVPDPSAVYINPVCLNFNGEYRFYNSGAVEEEKFDGVDGLDDKDDRSLNDLIREQVFKD